MKYFSFDYVKKHPWLFAGIILVVGVIVLMLSNQGADSETQYVQSGPSEAQLAAQTALGMKQLEVQGAVQLGGIQLSALAQQGQNDLALANVSAQVALAQIAASATAQNVATQAALTTAMAQIAANVQMNADNNDFQIAYAKNAQDNALAIVQVNAEAFTTASILNQIGTLKKGKRDNALGAFLATYYGDASATEIDAILDPNGAKTLPGYSSDGGSGFLSNIGSNLGGALLRI